MIEIELCRVSSDSKWLDLIFNTPNGYQVTSLQITAHSLSDNNLVETTREFVKISEEDIGEGTITKNDDQNRYVRRILLKPFQVGPAMYCVHITARPIEGDPDDRIDAEAWCSDVNSVYYEIVDDLLRLGEHCSDISNDAIKKYLILYGHQTAMYNGELDAAKMLFKILVKNFSNCGNTSRVAGNCGDRINIHNVKSNCGCKK